MMDRTVSLRFKAIVATLCFQHVCFNDILCFSRSKICKEFSFHIGKARLLLNGCSLPSVLHERKHIKYLYIPPIYREITLGTGKQTLYRRGGYEGNALSVLARNCNVCPALCLLSERDALLKEPLCVKIQNGLVCSSRTKLSQTVGSARATAKCIKPMFSLPHCG